MFTYDEATLMMPYILKPYSVIEEVYKISDKHEYLFCNKNFIFASGFFKGNVLSIIVFDVLKKRLFLKDNRSFFYNLKDFISSKDFNSVRKSKCIIENYLVGQVKTGKNLKYKYAIYDGNMKSIKELIYKKELLDENGLGKFEYKKVKLMEFKNFVKPLFEKLGYNFKNFRYYFFDASHMFYENLENGETFFLDVTFYSEYLNIVSVFKFKSIHDLVERYSDNIEKSLYKNILIVNNEIKVVE